ncbi:uncharacterized protein LOC116288974 isoform X1 [Actinia tenebrosa]|uniref:Uncharacterized protein LOC116288974 isoform X1 n=1 Tax=Actinia tenebrosa TaxID=6105 RepID=A0A6P8HGJ4_ACTTE|nr:uncharacterized protein LOC116288974 isoform X1 [Actinia tenebrosa]
MASNQEIVDQSSSNIDVMVVPESPDVAPNSPSLIGGLTNDQAAGTSTGDAGTSKKDEQPARKRIRIDLDEDSEEEGEEDEESKKDLEDLVKTIDSSVEKMKRAFSGSVMKMDALLETINKCYKISEKGFKNIELMRKTILGKDIDGQDYMIDLQHALDEANCLIDSERDEFFLDLTYIYDGY